MNSEEILNFPQVKDNIHESCYRSYHILFKVIEMVNRGDSKETINEMVELLKNIDKSNDDRNVVKTKNCFLCPFATQDRDVMNCHHPQRERDGCFNYKTIDSMFEKCPLKTQPIVIELDQTLSR